VAKPHDSSGAKPHVAAPVAIAADGLRIRVKVAPRAAANRIEGLAPEADGGVALKVAVTAAPEDGKANAALIKLLAREWGVAKSTVTVVAGAADRRKLLHVAGSPRALAERLERWLANWAAGGGR
jgi:uncharacterized protein